MKKYLGLVFLMIFFAACKKDEVDYSDVKPQIEFISITPSNATEFEDELALTISYRDGDGDLGENAPEVKNLFVKDSRNGLTYEYRIPQLAPSDTEIIIEGNLEIDLNTVAIVGTGDSETVTFDVHIVDRAGNISNTITTSTVTITR